LSKASKLNVKPTDEFRIDIDLDEAGREAARVRRWLEALRRRHDLSRFEYTRFVRVVPASPTYSHPILTLGTRFTDTEDQLLSTYLHEQMHWYLTLLGGPDHDPIAAFYDELVRRYPDAPTRLPDGARSYEQTYVHLVVNWLELAATAEFIGRERAFALAETTYGYRWIYRTIIHDWDALGALYQAHGILPFKPASAFQDKSKGAALLNGEQRKTPSTKMKPPSLQAPRKSRVRGGRLAD
jgi:hypothetical protein